MNDKDKRHIEIVEEAVRILNDYPELTYKECFIVVMELRGLNNTEAFKRVAGGGRW